jgi:hypothetical protein
MACEGEVLRRGFRTSVTLINKLVKDVKNVDVAYIVNLAREGKTNLHLAISEDVWRNWEHLDRETAILRVTKAREDMEPIHAFFDHL